MSNFNPALDRLLAVLVMIESNGNHSAIGDGGRSLGCLQIQRPVVGDVNQHFGTDFRWADALNRTKAEAIFRLYMLRYATAERIGAEPTMRHAAQIWNGGPNGFKKSSTDAYVRKVEDVVLRDFLDVPLYLPEK